MEKPPSDHPVALNYASPVPRRLTYTLRIVAGTFAGIFAACVGIGIALFGCMIVVVDLRESHWGPIAVGFSVTYFVMGGAFIYAAIRLFRYVRRLNAKMPPPRGDKLW